MKLPPNNWVINTPDGDCDLDMESVRVVLFAIPRSGSTLLYQILRQMFPEGGILWTHQFIPPPKHAWLIISRRDLRDCLVSHCRHRLPQIDSIREDHIRFLAGWFWQFRSIATAYNSWQLAHGHGAPCEIHYEDHGGDPLKAYSILRRECKRTDISEARPINLYTLERQRQRPIVDSGQHALMQPGHIGDGVTGSYHEALTGPCIELADDIFREYADA